MPLHLRATFLLCLLFCFSVGAQNKKCRALVLSATTDRGAYHAGVFDAILKNAADPAEFEYDVVTGTSIGALNAAVLAKYSPGDESDAAEELLDVWSSLTRDQVYQYWAGGYVNGLVFGNSLVDSSPFANFIYNCLSVPFNRRIVIGVTNADDGGFDTFNETNLNDLGDLTQLIMSTTAFPLYFQYMKWNKNTYIDGSILVSTDIDNAVNRCMEVVNNQSDIIVDIITTHGGLHEAVNVDKYNTLKILVRALDISLHAQENFQLYLSRLEYPEVNFRYIIQPTQILPGTFNIYSFDQNNIAKDIEIGQRDGAAAVKLGKFGNGAERIEKATEWLHKTHGMFSRGLEKVKMINQRLKEKQLVTE